jgi:hypothetical protein
MHDLFLNAHALFLIVLRTQLLAAALAKNHTIKTLDLSDNRVSGMEGVQKLCKVRFLLARLCALCAFS